MKTALVLALVVPRLALADIPDDGTRRDDGSGAGFERGSIRIDRCARRAARAGAVSSQGHRGDEHRRALDEERRNPCVDRRRCRRVRWARRLLTTSIRSRRPTRSRRTSRCRCRGRRAARRRTTARTTLAVKAGIFYGVGGALLLGAAIAFIVTRAEGETTVIHPHVAVGSRRRDARRERGASRCARCGFSFSAACSPDIASGAYLCGPQAAVPAGRGVRRRDRHVRAHVGREPFACDTGTEHAGDDTPATAQPDSAARVRLAALSATAAACRSATPRTGSRSRRRPACTAVEVQARLIVSRSRIERARRSSCGTSTTNIVDRHRHRVPEGIGDPAHAERCIKLTVPRGATTASWSSRPRAGHLRRGLRLQSVRSERAARHAGLSLAAWMSLRWSWLAAPYLVCRGADRRASCSRPR